MENNHSMHTQRRKQDVFTVTSKPMEDHTISTGISYDKTIVEAVWGKAQKVIDFQYFKYDTYGNIIEKHEYGFKSKYGWIIDLIRPESEGGTYSFENLQPVHWKHFLSKGKL